MKNMSAKISIITVCYNSEKTITRTFESILHQTNQNYEYIVIDGASKDNTLQIIKEYESKFQGKMTYISESDQGIYDAMNKGIKKGTGELIGILNSDDYYESNALEIMELEYEKQKSQGIKDVVLYGSMRSLIDGKEMAIEFYHHDFLGKVMINHPTCFVSKSVYEKYGMFDTRYKSAADLDLMMRLFKKTDTAFVPVYEVITNFERGGMSSTGTGSVEAAMIRYEYGLVPKKRVYYEKLHAWVVRIGKRKK